ncbi:cupin domain-containing protein [Paracoccus gahaiensis]|uniref:Cupin domain-containing protein n=1 Tax=Paracoccus gahaiensis TaxID=1706839 RepID=A0A4U0R8E8_9RHOB|nr:cupin domain-containing protein [Paracoccus gahaiensis]TJZ91076.1 cupin domain-containing protein [Paracoccus gahaiensis]
MAILRKDSVPVTEGVSGYPAPYNLGRGFLGYRHLTEAGGLTQFGIALETLQPGKQSSQPHWEEHEDEFLYLLEGVLTVVEDGVEADLHPGDACAWKAGDPVAHTLRNRTDAPVTYLIAGGRQPHNICHYPGLDLLGTPAGYMHLDGTPYPKTGETE